MTIMTARAAAARGENFRDFFLCDPYVMSRRNKCLAHKTRYAMSCHDKCLGFGAERQRQMPKISRLIDPGQANTHTHALAGCLIYMVLASPPRELPTHIYISRLVSQGASLPPPLPPRAPCTDGIPDAARWPTHPRPRPVRSSPYEAERQSALAPPARFPCDHEGRDRRGGAGSPARGGCPLPACGEPMRIKPHQTANR